MRVGVWQTEGEAGGIAANIAALAGVVARAAAAGVTVLVAPELWTTGYADADAIRAGSEPAEGPTLAAVAALARAHGVAIAYGYPEAAGALRYNSAWLIGGDGAPLRNYRKVQLWSDHERALFTPGPLPAPPVTLAGWQVALAICYDNEFPELIRHHALGGAELILAPTALAAGGTAIPDLIIPVRAIENGLYVAFANRCGAEATVVYEGGSCIVGPMGHKLASAHGEDTLIIADLDRAALAAARVRNPYLADRRGDLDWR